MQRDAADAQLAGIVDAEERHVDLMRDPRQWMPIRRVQCGERPANVCEREAAGDVTVIDDVVVVVEIREWIRQRSRVDDPDRGDDRSRGERDHAR